MKSQTPYANITLIYGSKNVLYINNYEEYNIILGPKRRTAGQIFRKN